MSSPNDAYSVTADELRQFIERFEQLEAEKKDVADQLKEAMAAAMRPKCCVRCWRCAVASPMSWPKKRPC